jgi:Zn-dependent metalloprotease
MSRSFRKTTISHKHTNKNKKRVKEIAKKSIRVVERNALATKDPEIIDIRIHDNEKKGKIIFSIEWDNDDASIRPIFNKKMYPENDSFNPWEEMIRGVSLPNYHYSGLTLSKKEQQRENYKRITK